MKKSMLVSMTTIVFLILVVGPLVINEGYKTAGGYITLWNAQDMLSYYGICVAALGTLFLGTVTLYLNKKFEEKNIDIQSKLLELTEKSNKIAQLGIEEAYKREYPFIDLCYKNTETIKGYENGYGMEYNNTLSLCCSILSGSENAEPNILTNVYRFSLILLNQNGNNVKHKCLHFSLKNCSDVPICTIKLTRLHHSTVGGCADDTFDKEIIPSDSMKLQGIVRRDECVHMEFEVCSNYEDFFENIEKGNYTLTFNFEIVTLSEKKYKQCISFLFNLGCLIDVYYSSVKPVVPTV